MTLEKRADLQRLIQFVSIAYMDSDINEQYRDWKNDDIRKTRPNKQGRAKSKKSIVCDKTIG